MTDFLELVPPQEGLEKILSLCKRGSLSKEYLATQECLGYIAAEDITSTGTLPAFPRSTVDGYAIKSTDSFGSTASMPSYFEIIGEIKMGEFSHLKINSGQVALIHTGGMVPQNADSVVMVEDTLKFNKNELEVYKAVSPGENVLHQGEDVKIGDTIILSGSRIRAVEIGGLLALGILSIPVVSKPRVAIISSGDEIIPPDQKPELGQIRDVNSHLLSALITQWGGVVVRYGIVPDNIDKLLVVSKKAFDESDMVVFTAGSSISVRDITAKAIRSLGEPGVLIHGINIKPGKPTILAICSGKPVVGLPGNPVSAYVTANIFVKNIIDKLQGVDKLIFQEKIQAKIDTNIASKAGREDWIPAKISLANDRVMATPVFSRSNFIFSLVSADGLIRIEADKTGINAGEKVSVLPIN